ncbi:MAG TPA: dihydrodipicolinate reductase [Armatimonadetes bacterium]|nr:dihydrodipicolinate reductase [Armatimonadota bacterium]
MNDRLRTVHVGLGTIGLEVLKAGVRAGICEPVACVDIAPQVAGRSLREVLPGEDLPELAVSGDLESALEAAAAAEAELAVVCTGSSVEAVEPQLTAAMERGLSCISTCEELVFPWLRAATEADRLDAVAVTNRVSLLGAGVNPGFVLDLFPFVMTRVCQRVDKIYAGRFLNASLRRQQLQAKIGSGMHPDDFRGLASQGRIGHVGLAESGALLADSLGWPWGEFEETIEPIVAEERVSSAHFQIAAGQVCGQHERLTMGDLRLELVMAHGEEERDEVRIEGLPPVHAIVSGGIHGDIAAAGAVINFMWPLMAAEPGLRTVTEVPLA